MAETALVVENLWKRYRIKASLKKSDDHIWALKNIHFEIPQGTVLGIIGRNGAGKSTLLKILSKVTAPTKGTIKINGKIASLLEVGTGFHQELSGKENIFLNGAILGMKRSEIRQKLDEIVDFSGVASYLDTPVKRYSSGMYMRLAFAIAAHLEPEILIIDEVLAIGDIEFQDKCLDKMKQVSDEGRTVLFVSHQMGSIANLCQQCILLEKGQLEFLGETQLAIKAYLNMASSERSINYTTEHNNNSQKEAYIDTIKIKNDSLKESNQLMHNSKIILEFAVVVNQWHNGLELGISLLDRHKRRVFTLHKRLVDYIGMSKGSKIFRLVIPPHVIVPAHYSWLFAIHIPGFKMIDVVEDVGAFQIIDAGTEFSAYEHSDYGCMFLNDYQFGTFD